MDNNDNVTVPEQTTPTLTPQRSLEERVQHLKHIISQGNEATTAIEENMKYIKEHEHLIGQANDKELGATYLPLHWSKHKEFIECIQMLCDLVRDKEELKTAAAAHSYTMLKEQFKKAKKDAVRNMALLDEVTQQSADLEQYMEQLKLLTSDSRTT